MIHGASVLARMGNRVISAAAGMLVFVMLAYGGYSIWDTAMLCTGAFVSDDLLKYRPAENGEDGESLADLRKLNKDVRAWLTVDDTNIDYPVVQGEDDMEYINKNVYGEFSLTGSIFLDSRNQPDFSDCCSLVYGHHMANGAMFGDIVRFTDTDYFEQHQTGTLYLTEGKSCRISIFACVETDAYDVQIYHPDLVQERDISRLLSYIRKKAVCYRDENGAGEQLIGMSTCSEAETNGRIVVFGWLQENSEREVS